MILCLFLLIYFEPITPPFEEILHWYEDRCRQTNRYSQTVKLIRTSVCAAYQIYKFTYSYLKQNIWNKFKTNLIFNSKHYMITLQFVRLYLICFLQNINTVCTCLWHCTQDANFLNIYCGRREVSEHLLQFTVFTGNI